jgi:2-keto-4-pentenoate hydratase/2-oxohepta-3-ene-1,7-dioic acid hydratase in catechol pathway
MQHSLDDLLAAVSTRCSIKMGDVMFTGDAGPVHQLAPGDRLTAAVGDKPVLDIKVKL